MKIGMTLDTDRPLALQAETAADLMTANPVSVSASKSKAHSQTPVKYCGQGRRGSTASESV